MLSSFLSTLLEGTLSDKAAGYLLILPQGATGSPTIPKALEKSYGVAHPDLMVVDGKGVDDIRACLPFLASSPMEKMRTLWIPNVDTLSNQAANAFLKSLEEPTPNTRLLLSTSRPEALLPTIRSRCQIHAFVQDKHLMKEELEAAGVSPTMMKTVLELSGGNIATAIALATAKDAITWAKTVHAWLNGKGKRPSLPATGKDGLSAMDCAAVFQAGLKPLAASASKLDAIDAWLAQNTDLTRPGLDVKTRVLSWYALFDR